jgi:glyoxylase-like metal-dependent hydrolase (beta-lactamase superfamily II)
MDFYRVIHVASFFVSDNNPMIHIQRFTFNAFQENTYVLSDHTKACVVIDPGCYEKSEEQALDNYIKTNALQVKYLLNTHGHVDHVLGNAFVKHTYKVSLYIHPQDEATLRSVQVYAPSYGFVHYQALAPDHFLNEGDKVSFGTSTLEIIFVPGHAPGHIAFYNKEEKFCIGGDVLFQRSIGRTDLPGGNYTTLIKSIRTKFFPLGDDMVVYPGHGESTTVGEERKYNPFLND